ncbi:hypothetical protein CH296_26710 [Rhodococcus sp. 14-2496-1d]|uniref:sugar ABC transporter substrate-binding protein n=1 Tax=Rhodococcus sp. 14-2496-1d TaxID=2023146 RepID=UPI000B9BFB22|nr:sugar ABC transporter substrate-binding protein [Rhodococcus sp. 14-2496-1d]OZF25707.1 hypothetical protein CH296_26710 [Rhodococcus sp. 14-2496-1d]
MRSSSRAGLRHGLVAVALATSAVVLLGACSSGETDSGGGETVPVDVGLDEPLQLPTGPLNVGVFMNDTTNAWQEAMVQAATASAEEYGWTVEIVSGGYDVQKQMNQVQTAAAQGKYDAILAVPIDGALECNAFSKILPEAGVLVTVGAQQLCGKSMASGDELWQSGTLNFVGGTGTTADYVRAWLAEAVERNPGPQRVAYVVGPQLLTAQQVIEEVAMNEFQPENPDFDIQDFIYTDYTTPDSYQATLDYLSAHPDTTVILSTYSPDMTRGVIQAVEAAGMTGRVKVVDSGGAQYSLDEITAGNVEFTSPLFPAVMAEKMMASIKDAQDGTTSPRFVSDIPEELGTGDVYIVDSTNVDSFTPQF